MKCVIGQCPFLGDYDFCQRNGKYCQDADCLLHKIVNDCSYYEGSPALTKILFTTMNVCEVKDD